MGAVKVSSTQHKRVVAHIPARDGSKRVKNKNIRLMDGKPMIGYAIEAARQAAKIDHLVVNTDSPAIMEYARAEGVEIYERPPALASDTATSDEFHADIISNMDCEYFVLINPVCPCVRSQTIDLCIGALLDAPDYDTVISCSQTQMQTFCGELPVNISLEEQLRPSQENAIVSILNWTVAAWKRDEFLKNYNEKGYAVLGTNRLLAKIPDIEGAKVSVEDDFVFCEQLLRSRRINA